MTVFCSGSMSSQVASETEVRGIQLPIGIKPAYSLKKELKTKSSQIHFLNPSYTYNIMHEQKSTVSLPVIVTVMVLGSSLEFETEFRYSKDLFKCLKFKFPLLKKLGNVNYPILSVLQNTYRYQD